MNPTELQDAAAALRAATVKLADANQRCAELSTRLDEAEKASRDACVEKRAAHEHLIRIASDTPVGE